MSEFIEVNSPHELFTPIEFEPGVKCVIPFVNPSTPEGDFVFVPRNPDLIVAGAQEEVQVERWARVDRQAVRLLEAVRGQRSPAEDADFISAMQVGAGLVRVCRVGAYRVYVRDGNCVMPYCGGSIAAIASDGGYSLDWEFGLAILNRHSLAFELIEEGSSPE